MSGNHRILAQFTVSEGNFNLEKKTITDCFS